MSQSDVVLSFLRSILTSREGNSGIRLSFPTLTSFFSKHFSNYSNLTQIIRFGLILLLFSGISRSMFAQSVVGSDVEARIKSLVESSAAPNAIWSVSVRNEAGNTLISFNERSLVRPASNLKLLTSGMVLHTFGPSHRFETPVYGSGTLVDGTWEGNIYIIGSGDPAISGKFFEDNRLHVFESILKQLQSYGIQAINGDIIGDVSLYADEPYPKGWEWDDLSFYYATEVTPLAFNGNCVDLEVRADGSPGDKPSITWFPFETDYIRFVNDQSITPSGTRYREWYRRMPGSNEIDLRSTLPVGYFEEECLSVPDASLFFVDTFKKFLTQSGIQVSGSAKLVNVPVSTQNLTKIGQHFSPTVSELVAIVNKDSDNLYTEMLMRNAAAHVHGSPITHDVSLDMVSAYIRERGFSNGNFFLKDGSGLAAFNLISTTEMTQYLHQITKEAYFDAFYNSLSVAGIDGNFANRFARSPLIGNLYGKSGFISGVRAISGYLTTKSDNTLIFSIVTNNYPVRTFLIDQVHQAILEDLYENF